MKSEGKADHSAGKCANASEMHNGTITLGSFASIWWNCQGSVATLKHNLSKYKRKHVKHVQGDKKICPKLVCNKSKSNSCRFQGIRNGHVRYNHCILIETRIMDLEMY